MYEVTQAYRTAIDSGAIEHIKGVITFSSGDTLSIPDEANGIYIEGSPHIESKCVENDDTFMFGQIFIGSVELTIRLPGASQSTFTGAKLSLEFGVDVAGSEDPEWIPLGVWDIASAEKGADESWNIRGLDYMNRMKAQFNIDTVGRCYLEYAMRIITERTGVEFEQDADEIAELAGIYSVNFYGIYYPSTYWDEIQMISQVVGGFAFINRSGKIEFRKFGSSSVLTVNANRRYNIRLAERPYSVDAIRYTDRYGQTAQVKTDSGGVATLAFAANRYMSDTSDNYPVWYANYLSQIADGLDGVSWYAGEIDYYGDPALDLGDMIALEAGVVGETAVNFLITGISWTFRGQQVLTSAGLPDINTLTAETSTSGGSSSGAGGGVVEINQITQTMTLRNVFLDTYTPELTGGKSTIARGGFAVKDAIEGWVNIGVVLLPTADSTGKLTVLLDEIAQVYQPIYTLKNGEYMSVHCDVPISPDAGKHAVRIVASGKAEITDITATVWGQDIKAHPVDYTFSDDYIYTIADNKTTITGYIGESLTPEIPNVFEGAPTTYIENTAFTESEITSVRIPEGVEEIR